MAGLRELHRKSKLQSRIIRQKVKVPAKKLTIDWHRIAMGQFVVVPPKLRSIALGQATAWGRMRERASLGVSRPRFYSEADGDKPGHFRIVRW